jgi:hypothetical protein
MDSAKARCDGIKAVSATVQTEDLKTISVPTPVMRGDHDHLSQEIRVRALLKKRAMAPRRSFRPQPYLEASRSSGASDYLSRRYFTISSTSI